MADQLDMFARPIAPHAVPECRPAPAAAPSIDQRCADFHAQNPHVLTEMLLLARERIANGATRLGVKSLWEELREHLRVTKAGEAYKLNNSFTAIYGRMLIERAPDLEPFVETRIRKSTRRTP